MALDSSSRVLHFLRSGSSFCKLDQKDSIMALSNASPTDPNKGMRPASRIRSVKDQEVNGPVRKTESESPPLRSDLRCSFTASSLGEGKVATRTGPSAFRVKHEENSLRRSEDQLHSVHKGAAIYRDRFTGEKCSVVGSQKRNHLGHVFRGFKAS